MRVGAILAIDQGTTGTTALVVDGKDGRVLARAGLELPQHFPSPGRVEHEPEELWATVVGAVREALRAAGLRSDAVAAIGLTNQRETSLVWDPSTGEAWQRAIVWQDRRTAPLCAELRARGVEPRVREVTGLLLDPYFSATKLRWMLDNHPGLRDAAEQGEALFGTVDSYLVWRMSGGAGSTDARHVTDATNASRTLLMDLRTLGWSDEMCALFDVPRRMLPRIAPSAGIVAYTSHCPGLRDGIPIAGIAGDQHAAMFGQGCFRPGDCKCTYGTGAFALVNTGAVAVPSRFGLLTTLAWHVGGQPVYALEGSCFIAGAAVQWLRDGLGIIRSASEVESLARRVPSADGVVFVPALAGLGAPLWDPSARGLLMGITRGTTAAHIARATLEAIAHQVDDLLRAMADDLGQPVARMRVDGGAAANDLLMQFQADLSGLTVERPSELESTARGAAMLAGIGAGLFRDGADASRLVNVERIFEVQMGADERARRLEKWHDAVKRTRQGSAPPGTPEVAHQNE